MKEKLWKILDQNLYGLILKIVGIGYQFIGIFLMFQKDYPIKNAIFGMCMGLIFIGLGEIINLLDQYVSSLRKK
ncbi:MAG: hypothetical protein IJ193_03230 [Bacilli bacterium]|nr:hypothetical protein [Bacilli bacterium]